MRNTRIISMVEIALCAALSIVLGLWEFRLPLNVAGGSISLAMLPIVLVALRRGPLAGALSGAIFGSFDLLMGKAYILHWAQVLLDYPLPYLLFGLGVGLFFHVYHRYADKDSKGKASALLVCAVFCGTLLRLISHVLSGAIFFSSYAGELNPWIYSIIYNAGFVIPSAVAVTLIAMILLPAVEKAVPSKN